MSDTPRAAAHRGSASGFTLVELIVAMGLLSAFLVMLVQMLGTSASVFDRGERGQELADRALTAQRAVERSIEAVVGPRVRAEVGEGDLDARLIVYRQSSGPEVQDEPKPVQLPVLRATARLRPDEEQRLLRAGLEEIVADDNGVDVGRVRDGQDKALAEELAELLGSWPRRGRGELILTAVPAPRPADAAEGYLELRAGLRLADPDLLTGDDLALVEMAEYQDLYLDPGQLQRATRAIASGLLHFDIQLWSNETQRWDFAGAGRGGERVWDTARAGMFFDEGVPAGDEFSLDLDGSSLSDPRDDVWPRWLLITLVVAPPGEAAPEAYLSGPLRASSRSLTVDDVGELPEPFESRFVKIGTEWIRYGDRQGRNHTGLSRGVRGTVAQDHPAGTAVRGGRTLQLVLPLVAGRDSND